jgi:hypothetical protein
MKNFTPFTKGGLMAAALFFFQLSSIHLVAQTPAFPGADGFGRFAKGARGVPNPEVYVVTTLNDSGPGSFRDAVSKPGRFVVFAVGGIITLQSDIGVAANITIAGQTAPGDGIVLFNKRVTFTASNNTICRFLRIRLGATNNSGKDASGIANGANMIFDHMSFTWGMDEVFSINWDGKNTAPDNITIQNSIIGQGLHRENHSAGGLIQTPDGGKVSLIRNLYISNKTRNPKVKGVNEFVNNVVYDWGNGNRLGDNLNYGWSGDAYIMGGSSGVSEVNIINNYFTGGPLTPPDKTTPFSRGTGTFYLYGAGNYFDNNKNGSLDGVPVPYDTTGYPGISMDGFKQQAFPYPLSAPALTAAQAYQWVSDSVGACYPRRDQVDGLLIDEVRSLGTKGLYAYRETDLPFSNGGVGDVFNAPAPLDTDADGMPDAWEDAQGLNKNNKQDAVAYSTALPEYLNIEVYINSLLSTPPPAFLKPPSAVTLSATSAELPVPHSRVIIHWKDNTDNETSFVLERSDDNLVYTGIAFPLANTTGYSDSIGLVPNKTYYYRIKAVSGADTSSYSIAVSVKTPTLATAPAVPAVPVPANGFQYAESTAGALTLKWTGSTNTENFVVYVGTDPGSLVQKATIPYTVTPSYVVTGITDFTTYYWRIDAMNNKGLTTGDLWSFRTTKVFAPGLVGHWSFDETGGRQVTDSSQYQDHGVLGLDDDNQSIRVAGKINNALDFATANPNMYVVSVPQQDQLYLSKSSFSLSFWMKAPLSLLPPDNNTSAYLLCKGSITRNAVTGATGKRFDIEFKNKQFRFAIDDDNDANGGGKDELQADGTPFFTGRWVHVTAIRDTASKKLRLFLNGSLVKETAIAKAKSGIGEASALIIGNIGELEFLTTTNKPAPYKGMIDEVRLYNYALSAPEINALSDTIPPTVLTKPATVTLQADGSITINPSDVDSGSFDQYGISLTLDKTTFDCGDIGAHTVTLTATDPNGNSAAATAIVTVTGVVPGPVITVNRNDPFYKGDPNTIYLGLGAKQVTLTAATGNSSGPFQYHWSPSIGLSNAHIANPVFTPSAAGDYTFTVQATNEYGCMADTTVTIHVIDARCGHNNNKLLLCYKGHNICVHPVVAIILLLLNHDITIGGCAAPLVTDSRTNVTTLELNDMGMSVYPNPATQQVTIRWGLADAGKYRVDLYDMNGRLLQAAAQGTTLKGAHGACVLDVSRYVNGLYLVKITTGKTVLTRRILVQH